MQLSIPSPNSGLDKNDLQLFVEAIGWMELGAFNESLNVLKELSQNAQENNDILKLHWHLRYKLHDYRQCQFIGNLLTQKYPNLVESWVLYAQSYYGESNYEKAFEILSSVREQFSLDWHFAYDYACYHSLTNRFKDIPFWIETAKRQGDPKKINDMFKNDMDFTPYRNYLKENPPPSPPQS